MDAGRYTTRRVPDAGALAHDPASGAIPIPDEAELAARFGDRIRLFVTRYLGNAADAEDVAQETLRRVLAALRAERLRDPGALPGFVYQTARHICQQKHRSAGRESRALERLHGSGDAPGNAPPPDALSALVTAERRVTVRAALDRLRAPDRALLRRLFYDGVTAAEVARDLAITPTALRVRKHRALRALARLLGDEDL